MVELLPTWEKLLYRFHPCSISNEGSNGPKYWLMSRFSFHDPNMLVNKGFRNLICKNKNHLKRWLQGLLFTTCKCATYTFPTSANIFNKPKHQRSHPNLQICNIMYIIHLQPTLDMCIRYYFIKFVKSKIYMLDLG